MHFLTSVSLVLAMASSTLAAGHASIVNRCSSTVYLTINRPGVFGSPVALKSGKTYSEEYEGTGNSLGVTKNSNFYSSSTPKLIL